MALVRGLTPLTDEDQGRERLSPSRRGNIANPTPTPSLSPSASPVSTFISPPQSNAGRIADALSALNPALQRFSDTQAQETEDELPGKLSAALTGKSLKDQRDILASTPEFQNRMAQNLGSQMLGQAQADQTLDTIRQQYADGTYDRTQPLDNFINPFITGDLKDNTNPHFAEAYRTRMLAGVSALRDADTKARAEQSLQQQDDLIFGSIKATVGQALDSGASADDAYKAIRNTFATVKTVANRPFNEQEGLLVQYLGQMANGLKDDPQYEKKYALINGILNTERTDPTTGQKVGSLLDSPQLGGAAAKVLNAARDTFNGRQQVDNYQVKVDLHQLAATADPAFKPTLAREAKLHKDWFTDTELVSLGDAYNTAVDKQRAALAVQAQKDSIIAGGLQAAQRGQLWSVGDVHYTAPDGVVKVYTGDDIRKDAIARFEQTLDSKYAAVANTPEGQAARFRDQVQFYSANLVRNATWEQLLKSAPASASTAVAAGSNFPPNLAQAYDLYMRLRAASPQLLQQHVDEKSQDFFELARVAQQYHHLDPSQALQLAVRATTDPAWDRSAPELSRRDLYAKATEALHNNISDALTSAREADNPLFGLVAGFKTFVSPLDLGTTWNTDKPITEVIEDARMLHRGLGIPEGQAITEAASRVKQNYATINGTAVRVGDKRVPSDFANLATTYINHFYDTHREAIDKLGYDKSDITILNIGDTPNWALAFRGHPAPIALRGANFSIPQLYQIVREKAAKETARDDAKINEAIAKEKRGRELEQPDNALAATMHAANLDGK